jgi:hypothetical protein
VKSSQLASLLVVLLHAVDQRRHGHNAEQGRRGRNLQRAGFVKHGELNIIQPDSVTKIRCA